MVGKNVYTKTTPKELENFQKFFATVEPFHIVIDGLNVAYSAGIKQTPETYCRLVSENSLCHFVRYIMVTFSDSGCNKIFY